MKIAEGLAKKENKVYIISRRETRNENKFEEINENVFTIRIYRGLIFPINGSIQGENEEGNKLWKFMEKAYFFIYRLILVPYTLFLIKKYRINAVVDRGSSKGIGVFSGLIAGIPKVTELIDPDYSKLSLKFTDKVFAYTKKIVPLDLHEKVDIVNAGVDTSTFKPRSENDIRKRYNLVGKKVIVYIGSLSKWHGVKDLIYIATKLEEDFRFLMVGNNLEELMKDAEENGVLFKFIFAGFVKHEDIPQYIFAADVAIAPFNPKEFKMMGEYGFYFSPVKIFEYMACGKPIVTSDIEIVRDIIIENECGLLAEPGDINSFVSQINKLFINKRLMDKLGENGRKAVIKKYSWDNVAVTISTQLQSM
jgi:glycosyltransferase involved in cell wall biosynthesis